MKLLGFSAAAAVVLPQRSEAFLGMFSAASPAAGLDLPGQWLDEQGKIVLEYAAHVSAMRLKHIRVKQVLAPHFHKHGRISNAIPPRSLWGSIGASLRVADRMVEVLGEPLVEIVSAYRTPSYNAACPGARSHSYHKKNVALDLKFGCSTGTVARVARALRANRLFAGGVGTYRTFVHVDTRGFNSDW